MNILIELEKIDGTKVLLGSAYIQSVLLSKDKKHTEIEIGTSDCSIWEVTNAPNNIQGQIEDGLSNIIFGGMPNND